MNRFVTSALRRVHPELLFFLGAYLLYIGARWVFAGDPSTARDHAMWIVSLERSLHVEVDESVAESNISVSLGLIVTELVINALKHAFPGRRHGKITVGYNSDGPDWALSVSDDGVGMPADPHSAKSGLGTGIVEALARQLGAEVQVAGANPGTKVSIVYSGAATPDVAAV